MRDEKVCDFYTGIRKITSMPAERLRLDSRKGYLKEGYDADIVIFDPERIEDRATFDEPLAPPLGIDTIIVNGKPVLSDGTITDRNAGRSVRGSC